MEYMVLFVENSFCRVFASQDSTPLVGTHPYRHFDALYSPGSTILTCLNPKDEGNKLLRNVGMDLPI
jgi:hypothetical protein